MGFFGIGTWELGLIMVVALIVFGPGKLPEVAGQMGKAVRDFRRMTSELTGEFEKTINEAQDIKNSVTGELTGIKGQVANVTSSVKKDLNSASATVPGAAKSATATKSGSKPATVAKRSVTAAKTASASVKPKPTNGATKPAAVMATKADPLADVSEMDDEPVVVKRPSVSARQAAPPPAAASPERAEALARARQRRLATTYTKKRSV